MQKMRPCSYINIKPIVVVISMSWKWKSTVCERCIFNTQYADVNTVQSAYELKNTNIQVLFQPLYSKRHVSFSHLHPDHYNWWKKPWLRKSKQHKILAFRDRTLRSLLVIAASIVHVINTLNDCLCWALEMIWFLFFSLFFFPLKAKCYLLLLDLLTLVFFWQNLTTESKSAHTGCFMFLGLFSRNKNKAD